MLERKGGVVGLGAPTRERYRCALRGNDTTSTMTDRTPILVGISHIEQRIKEWTDGDEPLDLMIQAVEAARADTGVDSLFAHVDAVHVVRGLWWYDNPAAAIAEALGIEGAETGLTVLGGNMVQYAVSQAALDIQAGRQNVVVVTGAECGNVLAKARRAGEKVAWREVPGTPDRLFDKGGFGANPQERTVGLGAATTWYALFENAIRAANGETIDEHMTRVSTLWSRFSEVASKNPNAWFRDAVSAEDIRTVSASNRAVTFPYPKLMNSNNNVDQAAALILMDADTARSFAIPESQRIYPWASTHGTDTAEVSHRDNLYTSPAIRVAGNRCLELAGVGIDEIDHLDLYSCFPSAVQVSAKELAIDPARDLTVTGGLTFGGGPLNNYVMHAIVRMAEILRAEPDTTGFVTSNGGLLTKHAFCVYAARPPAQPFRYEDCQEEIDSFPSKQDVEHVGDATIESYVVMYQGDAPSRAIIAALTDDDQRTWAFTEDLDWMTAMTREEAIGARVAIDAERRAAKV